jgi:hypothetical protein
MPIFGRKNEEPKVPLNNDVVMKCMCGMCPVQTQSACSVPKLKMMMDMRANMGMKSSEMPAVHECDAKSDENMKMPKPEELADLLFNGQNSLNDHRNKACICPHAKCTTNSVRFWQANRTLLLNDRAI